MLKTDPKFMSPELEVICWSISAKPNMEAAIRELLKKNINWTKLINTAREHDLLPLLYAGLVKQDKSLLPPDQLLQMETYFRNNALHNLRLAQTLHWIIKLLSENDIEVIAFKGPALAIQAYGDLSLRTFADLDILVHPQDFYRLCDVLSAAGLRSNVPFDKYMKKYWQRFHKNIEFTDGINVIDVHQQVTPGPKRFSLKGKAWKNQSTVDLLFSKIPVLSPEHSLLGLCVHGTQNGWRSLKIIADINHLISGHPGLDWKSLINDAREIGCLRMLWVGLGLSQKISETELPEEIQKPFDNDQESGFLSEKILRLLLDDNFYPTRNTGETLRFNNVRALIQAMDSAAAKIGYLAYFTFAPTALDWRTFKLPGFLYRAYFLLRPLRLLYKLLSFLLLSLVKRRKKVQVSINQ